MKSESGGGGGELVLPIRGPTESAGMRKSVEDEGWQSGRRSLGGGSSKGSGGGHWMKQIIQH